MRLSFAHIFLRVPCCGLFLLPAVAAHAAVDVHQCIEQALDRLYNFDFQAAHRILDSHMQQHPADPVGYGIRAAAYLFFELDRLSILASEFFADNRRIAQKNKLAPDPLVREKLYLALENAESFAAARLAKDPNDVNALFALCLKEGVLTDYKALVQNKGLRSLSNARQSNRYAMRLLQIQPDFHDAYLTTGVNEYLLASLPFFVRWFLRMDGVQGSKQQALADLELVARHGRYLGPFAKILLAIICLREKQPQRAARLLSELTREYPDNHLLRNELAKITEKLNSHNSGTHNSGTGSEITKPQGR